MCMCVHMSDTFCGRTYRRYTTHTHTHRAGALLIFQFYFTLIRRRSRSYACACVRVCGEERGRVRNKSIHTSGSNKQTERLNLSPACAYRRISAPILTHSHTHSQARTSHSGGQLHATPPDRQPISGRTHSLAA